MLVARASTWGAGRRCVFPQFGVGHESTLGLVRSPVDLSGLCRWSPSGAFAAGLRLGLSRLHGGRILCGKVPNNAYSQDTQEIGESAGAY